MADIVRRIDRLRLAAQRHVVQHIDMRRALCLFQDAVEHTGLDHLPLGEWHIQRAQEIGIGKQLLLRRLLVHAQDQRHACLFQRFGGSHIGLDHEFFDQPHGFQPLAIGDGFHLAVFADHDAPFRQIEVQRIAHIARLGKRLIGAP